MSNKIQDCFENPFKSKKRIKEGNGNEREKREWCRSVRSASDDSGNELDIIKNDTLTKEEVMKMASLVGDYIIEMLDNCVTSYGDAFLASYKGGEYQGMDTRIQRGSYPRCHHRYIL